MNYSPLQLHKMRVYALYLHNAQNRLLRVNEPDPHESPPRFYFSRTVKGRLWRVRSDVPEELATELGRLADTEPAVSNLHQPPLHQAKYIDLLEQHGFLSDIHMGLAYYLPILEPSKNVVTITLANSKLLHTNFAWALNMPEAIKPVVAMVANGVAVAACFSARKTSQVAEAGVYTVEGYRNQGFATEVVRGWATETRATGIVPLYSTSSENRASQMVASKLAAVQYCKDFSFT